MEDPKISIIIPSLNMATYIEQTILSIIDQNYKNLELIIVDGGSTDGTWEIISRYSKHIFASLSEKDEGMYHAVERGVELSSGSIVAWLNADDVYFPWTLSCVSRMFSQNAQVEWLCGTPSFLNEDGSIKKIYNDVSAKPKSAILNGWFKKGGYGFLQQESMFWRRELFDNVGGLDLSHNLAADFELWTRFAKFADLWTVDLPLAAFRLRTSSLSKKHEVSYLREVNEICRNLNKLPLLLRLFGGNKYLNMVIRILSWKKTKIIHQPFFSDDFICEERFRSCSSLTLTKLLLERPRKANTV